MGRDRWKINLYVLWVTQVMSLMGFGMMAPFLPFHFQDIGVTDPTRLNFFIGLSAALPSLSFAIAAPIWGILGDKYGRKPMIMRALIAATIIVALYGFTTNPWQIIALRVLQGGFTGTVTAAMTFVSSDAPEDKMSYALGFMASANAIGFSVGPLIGGVMYEMFGFQVTCLIGAGILTIGVVMAYFFVVEKRRVTTVDSEKPKEKMSFAQKMENLRGGIFSKEILFILAIITMASMARNMFQPFMPLYIQQMVGGSGAAGYTGIANGVISGAVAISAIGIARLGDKLNKFKLALTLSTLALPAVLLWISAGNIWTFIITTGIFFIVVGGIDPLLTTIGSQKMPSERRGVLFGIIGTVTNVALVITPMVGSAMSTRFGVHSIMFLLPVVICVQIALLFSTKNRQKVTDDV